MRLPIKTSDFARNVLTLMLGTALAQALPVAISPILTRLYSPEDFGLLALFLALITVVGTIANGRYELAIMLPETDEDALNLAALGLCLATAISIILFIAVGIFGASIATLLGDPQIQPWLFLTPVAVLFTGLFNSLNYYATRQKRYRDVATANIAKAVVGGATQIVLGLVTQGPSGLIIGQTAATGAANARLAKRSLPDLRVLRSISWQRMRHLARKYRDFPKYSMWAALANTLSSSATVILLARYYSLTSLGFYALAQRTLEVPLALIARSIGQVFYQEASASKRATGTAKWVFRSTLLWLTIIMVPLSIGLFFSLPSLFAFVFGAEWREAGDLARILVPLFAIRFIVVPLSLANQVNLKNRLGMIGNVVLLIVTVAAITMGGLSGMAIEQTLATMCAVQSTYYLGFLYVIYRHVAAVEIQPPREGDRLA